MRRQRPLLSWCLLIFFVAGAPNASGQSTLTFADSQGNPITKAFEYSQITLRAVDPSSAGLSTLVAYATSDIRGDRMGVSLQEDGSHPGTFIGWLYLNAVPPGSSNGSGLSITEDPGPPHRYDTVRAVLDCASPPCAQTSVPTVAATLHLLDAQGQPLSRILPGSTSITLEGEHWTSPSFAVTLTALPGGDTETVSLPYVGGYPDHLFFRASVPTTQSPSVPGDGQLQIEAGGTVVASHNTYLGFGPLTVTTPVGEDSIELLDRHGNPASAVLLGGPARVRVSSPSANLDPNAADVLIVHLRALDINGTTRDIEDLQLQETGASTGVFTGQMNVAVYPPSVSPNDGTLQVDIFDPRNEMLEASFDGHTATAPFLTSIVRVVDAAGADRTQVAESDTIHVQVECDACNQNPARQDFLSVRATSGTTGDMEYFILLETEPGSAIFEGSVQTVPATGQPVRNHGLEVVPGDTVLVESGSYYGTDSDSAVVVSGGGPVNFGPNAENDLATTPLGTPVSIDVLANDSDPDGDALTVALITEPVLGGTVTQTGPGILTYTPPVSATTLYDYFIYRLVDARGAEAVAFVNVQVRNNNPPFANSDLLVVNEDSSGIIDVVANDNDPNGDSLSLLQITQPAHGTAVSSANFITYAPAPNYNGSDFLTYTVSDGQGGTATGTLEITVTPVNDPPVAVADSTTLAEDTMKVVYVLDNDADADGDSLSITGGTQPAHGSAYFFATSVSYSPAPNYNGPDSFTYSISDGHGGNASATVSLTVTPVNDPPVGVRDDVTTLEDTPVTFNVLTNDTDVDGDTLTLLSVFNVLGGSVTWSANGTVTFTPMANFNGPVTFTYGVDDGHGMSAFGTVRLTITPVNDPPVAVADSATTPEDTPLTINVLNNDTDVDGDMLIITAVIQPAHGSVSYSATTVTYTPAANYNGADSFTYSISDQRGGTATGTVNMTVTAQPDLPVAVTDAAVTLEDTPVTINVLANDFDPDGDTALTTSVVVTPAKGTVIHNLDQSFTYTPRANLNGLDSFIYRVTDSTGRNSTTTVSITITPVNDPPTAFFDSATTAEDTAVTFNVLANDSDIDGDSLTLTAVTQPANGSVVFTSPNVTYTPAANFNGSDSFTYTVSDGHGGTTTGAVNVNVTAVNDPPAAAADSATTAEDTAVTINVLANDTDVDADILTVTAVTQPAHGTVTFTTNGVTYRPAANYNGPDSFTYSIGDGHGGTATAAASVNVTAVNDPPAAAADSATTAEDTPVTINVLTNDTDVEGDTLTVTTVTQPAHGAATFTATNATYTPAANYNGPDSFTYSVSDGNGGTATATVNVTVTPVNDPPAAAADSTTTAEDTAATVAVLANDIDVDGNSLTVTAVTQPAHGSATFTATSATYTPAANYNGPDSFTYSISDGNGGTATATVNVTVNPVNDPPAAAADSATTVEDSAVTVNVLTNDTDVEGDSLNVTGVTQPAHGTAAFTGANVTYTPAANYNGPDSFTYSISDGRGGTATGTVNVTVTAVNDPPAAGNDSVTTAEDTAATVSVLANDTDAEGDSLTVTAVTQPTHGTATFTATSATYTPAANYNGPDSFTYSISDGNGGTATGTVSVNVTAVNDPPAAVNDSVTTAEDTAATVAVLANDTDPEGDSLAVTAVTQPAHGTASRTSTTVTYTPAANYNGADSFTYSISDGHGGTATGTVSVTVTAVNDPPAAVNDSVTTAEDTAATVAVLANDTDLDGDSLTVTAVTQPAHGSAAFTGTDVTYTPAVNYNGPDSFTYSIGDGHGGTATATVSLNVTAVNDPPIAVNDTATTREGVAVTVSVLANDSDVEGSALTVTNVSPPAHGTASFTASSVTYTPAANFNGIDSFTYTVSDGAVLSAATVTVTVKDSLERVAVLATNSAWIQTGADVLSGDVVINQAGAGPFLNGAELSLAGTVTTPSGWDLDADSLTIAAGTTVASDVFFNQITNSGTITGQQTSSLTLPVFSTLPAFLTATPNTTDVNVANNGTRTLAPGTYRDLILGRKATVTFTGGTYHFRSIRTTDVQAKLLFSAASTVRVQQTFKTLGTTTIGPASGASVTAAGIVFYIGGINGTGGGITETPKAVEIGTDNVLTANLYAPNGTLWIADRTQARGSFIGKDVLVGPDVQVTLQTAWTGQ